MKRYIKSAESATDKIAVDIRQAIVIQLNKLGVYDAIQSVSVVPRSSITYQVKVLLTKEYGRRKIEISSFKARDADDVIAQVVDRVHAFVETGREVFEETAFVNQVTLDGVPIGYLMKHRLGPYLTVNVDPHSSKVPWTRTSDRSYESNDTECAIYDDMHSSIVPVLSVYIPSELGFQALKARMQSAAERDYFARMHMITLPDMPNFRIAPISLADASTIDVENLRDYLSKYAVDIESLNN